MSATRTPQTVGGEGAAEAIARVTTFLRATVGSSLHGLAVEGTDDRDLMGVCLEPPQFVIGLRHFEQYVSRTQPEGVRSGPGDTDLVVYSLRKWARLALNGNPSVLLLLFAPREVCDVFLPPAAELQALAPAFASKRAGAAFLGYMQQQRQRLLGERGQKNVKRPELVEAFGYDTKYAGHIIRLGFQGIEFLRTGRLTLPMAEDQRDAVLAVRRGEVDENAALTLAGELEAELKDAIAASLLPEQPNRAIVDAFLQEAYLESWERP